MSVGERHKWCARKILESFPDIDNEQVQSFIRHEAVMQKFNAFFKGETSGRLFVLYQPPIVDGEVSSHQLISIIYFSAPNFLLI